MDNKEIDKTIRILFPFNTGDEVFYFSYKINFNRSETDKGLVNEVIIYLDVAKSMKNKNGEEVFILSSIPAYYIYRSTSHFDDIGNAVNKAWRKIPFMIRELGKLDYQDGKAWHMGYIKCISITNCIKKYIPEASFIAPYLEADLLTLQMLVKNNGNDKDMAQHYKTMKRIYEKAKPLTYEEEEDILSVPISRFQSNIWPKKYRMRIFYKLLDAYKEKTGEWFIPFTALNGVRDDLDKRMLACATSLMNDSYIPSIQIQVNKYLKDRMVNVEKVIKKFNFSQMQRIIQSKGKLVGYKFKENNFPFPIIRLTLPDKIEKSKDGRIKSLVVYDYPIAGSLEDIKIGKTHWHTVSPDDIITFSDITKTASPSL